MEHQSQRDGEGWHHYQRIRRDEDVRRIVGQKMRNSRRGQRTHRNRYDEVGDAKQAPGIDCSASARRLLRQQDCNRHCNDAGHNVTNPSGQCKLPRHASISPKHEKEAASNTINLSRHDPRKRCRGRRTFAASGFRASGSGATRLRNEDGPALAYRRPPISSMWRSTSAGSS